MDNKSLDPLVDTYLKTLASEKARFLLFIQRYDKNLDDKDEYDYVRGRNIEMSYHLQNYMLERTGGNFNSHYEHLKSLFDSYLSIEIDKIKIKGMK